MERAADISFRTQSGAMRYMKQTGTGTFSSMFGDRSILSHNATTHEYTYVESDGTKTIFNDLTHTTAPGQMTSQVAPGGQTTTLTGTIGASLDAQRINTTGGVTRFESFLQNYYASGSSVGKLQSVLLRRGDAGQPWENIERLTLTYYDGTTSYGSLNDLKSSTKEIWDGSAWVAPKVTYYRYYIAGVNTDIGFVHGLRYVVNPAAWEKMVSDSIDPLTAADSVIAAIRRSLFPIRSLHSPGQLLGHQWRHPVVSAFVQLQLAQRRHPGTIWLVGPKKQLDTSGWFKAGLLLQLLWDGHSLGADRRRRRQEMEFVYAI